MTFRTKDSGIEWVGHIPSHWSTRRIKFLANREENSFIDGDWIESPYVIDKGIPYFTTGNIGDGVFKPSDSASFISKESFEELKCKFAYGGDLIFSRLNAPYGRSCLLPLSVGKCVIAVDNVILRTDQCKEFVCYVTQCPGYQKMIEGLSAGTAMKRISRTRLGNVKIPLPPLAEQRSIATFLNKKCCAIDSLIASKQALLEKLEEYRKAVITKAVTKGLNPNVNMKDSGISWIGEIPSNWQIVKVKQVTSLVTDGAHVAPETENGVYDFVSTVDIDNDTIDFNSCLKTSESSYEYLVATKCKPNIGDVLISKDGTVGKTVVVKDDRNFVVASSLVILRPKVNLVMPYFLNYALRSNIVQETLASLMHGAGLKRVSVEKNANLQIVLPPIGEQQEIISFLDEKCSAINCLISKEQETVKKLREYRSSLITAAVTGKIDVTNIHPKEQ